MDKTDGARAEAWATDRLARIVGAFVAGAISVVKLWLQARERERSSLRACPGLRSGD